MTQSPFERFRYSFFDDPYSARDGLDIEALEALEGADREKAEELLIAFLPDARGIIGLGVLRSRKAAAALQRIFDERVEALREAQAARSQQLLPWKLIEAGKALWLIAPRPEWRDALIDVYNFSKDNFARLHVVEAMYVMHDPVAVDTLTRALDDRASLVRHHAGRALCDRRPADRSFALAALLASDRSTARARVCALAFEQSPLAFDAPAISRQRAVAAYHAVARHQDRDGVGGARTGHRAHAAGRPDCRGDLRVTAGGAGRDGAQRFPHAALEGGALDIERQIGGTRRLVDLGDDVREHFRGALVCRPHVGLGEAAVQVGKESGRIVPKQHRAQALVCASS